MRSCNAGNIAWSTIALSPQRQRAAHNLIRNYVFNGYRRLASHVPYWIVPFAIGEQSLSTYICSTVYRRCMQVFAYMSFLCIGYGTYTWAKKYDAWQNSKAAHVAGHSGH